MRDCAVTIRFIPCSALPKILYATDDNYHKD